VTAKRIALLLLLASVGVACVIGVVGIFVRDVNQVAFRAMFTSIVLAGCCLLAVACLAAWEQPGANAPTRIGIVSTLATAALLTAGMWLEPRSDTFWQIAGTVSLFAVAGAHASVLWLARLGPRAHWMRSAALVGDVLLAMLILAAIWGGADSDATLKAIAALSIVEGGATVAIAAISTANRIARPGDGVAEVCFCPRCGKALWMPAGEVRCRHCDEVFFIELRQQSELPSAIVKS
jgi:hypothetical protein